MKVAFYTLGCKVNQYESQALSEEFSKKGYEIVSSDKTADVYVVHSCSVTKVSDTKSKKAVNHLRRKNPNAVIALMGCFPQGSPKEAYGVLNADIVLGTKDKLRLIPFVEEFLSDKKRILAVAPFEKEAKMEKMSITSFNERTRAFLKIQDGCNRFCSYCIIPYARGRICSKPLDEIKKEVEVLAKKGYCEIVLVGIDLSCYGKEFSKDLVDAVETAASVSGIKRIRLGSLEPEVISDKDIERLKKIKTFCPQFHLSLQSGCDETLKRMNRHYDTALYKDVVNKLRKAFKNASITTDVMVGFAGETQEEFEASLEFVKSIGFLKAHVFPYSVRKGTRAEKFENQVAPEIKKERAHIMSEACEKIREEILRERIGEKAEILVEGKQRNGMYMGYTVDYIPVYLKECTAVCGEIISVCLQEIFNDGCFAKQILEEK